MKSYGLLAADPIRWLLEQESDVKKAVESFIVGQGDDFADVAGPPSMSALMLFRAAPKKSKLPLPTVRLYFKKIRHPLHGDGVAVTCSADEMAMIESWRQQARSRRALAGEVPKEQLERENG